MDPAHVRTFKVTQSDHPANIISLCRECHQMQHKDGWLDFIRYYPHVGQLLLNMGWDLIEDPFRPGRLILSHPEVK